MNSVGATRLEHAVLAHASERPEEVAISFRRNGANLDVSWRQLLERACAIATEIEARGSGRGDLVGVLMDDSPDCHASVYACFLANVTLVPIDPLWGDYLVKAILAHGGVKWLIAPDSSLLQRAARLLGSPTGVIDAAAAVHPMRAEAFTTERSVDDVALLAYTSGSTASPKAVPLRHRNLSAAYTAARTYLFGNARLPGRFGAVMRLSGLGILGMNYLFAHQCGVGTVVLPEITIASAATFWKSCREQDIGFIYLVPLLVNVLNKLARPEPGPEGLLCLSAAAPLSEEAQRAFQTNFQVPLRNGYGLTEASFMFTYGAVDEDGVGLPTIGRAESIRAEIRVGNERVRAGPARGDLWIAGPMVAEGYYRNEAATLTSFVDGGLLTGDIVERDAQGFMRVVGRSKDVVLRGGFTISLDEVESTLMAHAAVIDACALGLCHGDLGEELYAAVCVRGSSSETEQSLLGWCRQSLGVQRAPRRIVFLQKLVRNAAGKLIRAENRHLIVDAVNALEQTR